MLYIFGSNGIEVSPDYVAALEGDSVCRRGGPVAGPQISTSLSVAKPFLVKLNKERWSAGECRAADALSDVGDAAPHAADP